MIGTLLAGVGVLLIVIAMLVCVLSGVGDLFGGMLSVLTRKMGPGVVHTPDKPSNVHWYIGAIGLGFIAAAVWSWVR